MKYWGGVISHVRDVAFFEREYEMELGLNFHTQATWNRSSKGDPKITSGQQPGLAGNHNLKIANAHACHEHNE